MDDTFLKIRLKSIILFSHYFTIFFCLSLSISAQDTILLDVLNFRNPIRQLVKDANGKIYIQTYEGVYVLNDRGFEKSSFKLSNFERIGVKNGKLTILNHYAPGFKSFEGSHAWYNYLPSNGTNRFCQMVVDYNGNYWVANGSKFLYCFNIIKSFNKSLPNVSIRGITKFNQDLIVLSHSGLFLNREKIEIEHLGSSTNVITNNNKVYFASSSSAVYSFDVNAKNCTKIIDEKKNEHLGEISSLWIFLVKVSH
jgi:ligand-binding sensor domain-containing protein